MSAVDLNVDIGEGMPHDMALLDYATSANVCCGVHAGSLSITRETVEMCAAKGIRIGSHPGYPDRTSMGRSSIPATQEKAYLDSVLYQIREFCHLYPAQYVKPHGAFYNDLAIPLMDGWNRISDHPGAKSTYEAGGQALSHTPGTGMLIIALRIVNLPLMGLAGTMHEEIAKRAGVTFIREGFADRRYRPDGTLTPRSEAGAVLTDLFEIQDQVLRLAERVDSICLHGDNESAPLVAEWVVRSLVDAGHEVLACA